MTTHTRYYERIHPLKMYIEAQSTKFPRVEYLTLAIETKWGEAYQYLDIEYIVENGKVKIRKSTK